MDGKEIQKLREEKDLTRRELALLVGITPEFVRCIEKGQRHPSDRVIFDIKKALGLTDANTLPPIRGMGRPRASEKTIAEIKNEHDEYIRIEALKAACIAFSRYTPNSIIKEAKVFEAYLKGEQHG